MLTPESVQSQVDGFERMRQGANGAPFWSVSSPQALLWGGRSVKKVDGQAQLAGHGMHGLRFRHRLRHRLRLRHKACSLGALLFALVRDTGIGTTEAAGPKIIDASWVGKVGMDLSRSLALRRA